MLGEMHYCGRGVVENCAVALDYFKEAANQTDSLWAQAGAWLCLGEMYYRGERDK